MLSTCKPFTKPGPDFKDKASSLRFLLSKELPVQILHLICSVSISSVLRCVIPHRVHVSVPCCGHPCMHLVLFVWVSRRTFQLFDPWIVGHDSESPLRWMLVHDLPKNPGIWNSTNQKKEIIRMQMHLTTTNHSQPSHQPLTNPLPATTYICREKMRPGSFFCEL